MSYPLDELRSLPRDELIRRHDEAAQYGSVGVGYYLDELARRDAAEQTTKIVQLADQMAKGTETVKTLTWVVAALTLVIAILTAASFIAVLGAD